MPPQKRRRKKSKPALKRVMVEGWITDGLRLAVGGLVRKDGKPATDEQCRDWLQKELDDLSVTLVDEYEHAT